jgi:hypothetical protein
MYHAPRRYDGHLAYGVLGKDPVHGPSILEPNAPAALPFLDELERRGYDITTLRMSVQLRDDHAWIKPHALIYPQAGGKPAMVDWIRWRGAEVTVFFMSPGGRHDGEIEIPRDAGRMSWAGGRYSWRCMSLGDVEQLYQPTPAEPPEWSPDDLPPMFAEVLRG